MTTIPLRIQRKRTRGWRMPPDTVNVTRPGQFGNPFQVGESPPCSCRSAGECEHARFWCDTAAEAVEEYRMIPRSEKRLAEIRRELCGKNLACWCRLCPEHADGKPLGVKCDACDPCHADVLLEIANV